MHIFPLPKNGLERVSKKKKKKKKKSTNSTIYITQHYTVHIILRENNSQKNGFYILTSLLIQYTKKLCLSCKFINKKCHDIYLDCE